MSSFIFNDSYPQAYIDNENAIAKKLNMVVWIEDLDQGISLVPVYSKVKYGDPGIVYGTPGLVYGAFRLNDKTRVGLSLESNLTISQRLEPEQGRASVSTMSLVFVDINEWFSALISPGQTLDEILGNKLIKIYIGYQNQSFPEDYFVVFRGYASNTRAQAGKITIQLSDSNLKRRSKIFSDDKTSTVGAISDTDTSIQVLNTDAFIKQTLGPNGGYDSSIRTLLRIEDELMEYGPSGIPDSTHFTVTRGVDGTTAVAHDNNTDIVQVIRLEGNCIDIALKIMMSGWGGAYKTDVKIMSIKNCADYGIFANALRMPNGYDLVDNVNVRPGDYVTVTGSTQGNDGTYIVESIDSSDNQLNNILFFTTPFPGLQEYPASTVTLSFRSKYDVYPNKCGAKMRPSEVDVAAWEDLRDTFYPDSLSQMLFFIDQTKSAKEFIEKEILLPTGAYSVTRFGRLSCKITLPPIAGQKINVLDKSNVKEPGGIIVERALNTRRFFNEISYSYDHNFIFDKFLSTFNNLDTDSLNKIGVSSVMPIQSLGIKTGLNGLDIITKKSDYLLSRYKDAAFEIQNIKTNWGVASLIEAGDTIVIQDNGDLQITNLSTGERNLGTQLFEVIDRSIDIRTGDATLKVLSNIGYQISDRFGVISPTSQVAATGSTASQIKIEDSFGKEFPNNESKKWDAIIGQRIYVHKKDYSMGFDRILTSFSTSDPYLMNIDSPIGVPLDADWVVDVADYSDTIQTETEMLKTLYSYIDPVEPVVAGIDQKNFTVLLANIDKFAVGQPVSVHNADFSLDSVETTVQAINVNQITVKDDLGFVPSTGDLIELIGFKDGKGPYRIL